MSNLNKFDNLGTIKERHPTSKEQLLEIAKGKALMFKKSRDYIKSTEYIGDVNYFIYRIEKLLKQGISIPVWKIIIPCFAINQAEWNMQQGAIYYIVSRHDYKKNLMFRGTYGYWGTGPHESARIEEYLEMKKIPIEIRSGDYLLGFLMR